METRGRRGRKRQEWESFEICGGKGGGGVNVEEYWNREEKEGVGGGLGGSGGCGIGVGIGE